MITLKVSGGRSLSDRAGRCTLLVLLSVPAASLDARSRRENLHWKDLAGELLEDSRTRSTFPEECLQVQSRHLLVVT